MWYLAGAKYDKIFLYKKRLINLISYFLLLCLFPKNFSFRISYFIIDSAYVPTYYICKSMGYHHDIFLNILLGLHFKVT